MTLITHGHFFYDKVNLMNDQEFFTTGRVRATQQDNTCHGKILGVGFYQFQLTNVLIWRHICHFPTSNV